MSRPPDTGLLEAVRHAGGTVVGMLQSRLELVGIELAEARGRLVVTLVAGIGAALLLCGAVVALTAWMAALAWPSTGPAVLGWIAAAYGLGGIVLLLWLRARWRSEPPMLGATLTELRADAASLRRENAP